MKILHIFCGVKSAVRKGFATQVASYTKPKQATLNIESDRGRKRLALILYILYCTYIMKERAREASRNYYRRKFGHKTDEELTVINRRNAYARWGREKEVKRNIEGLEDRFPHLKGVRFNGND